VFGENCNRWFAHSARVANCMQNSLQTIETTNAIEARRARYAQYTGREATLTLMGSTVTGMVRSVNEHGSGTLKRWTIMVVAK
jgi:hypothetical protein